MIKHFCDRCGKEIPSIMLYSIGEAIPETALGDYELCHECYDDFRKWIKNDYIERRKQITDLMDKTIDEKSVNEIFF